MHHKPRCTRYVLGTPNTLSRKGSWSYFFLYDGLGSVSRHYSEVELCAVSTRCRQPHGLTETVYPGNNPRQKLFFLPHQWIKKAIEIWQTQVIVMNNLLPVALMSDKLGEPNLLFEKELSHCQRKEQQRVAAFGAGTHTVRASLPAWERERKHFASAWSFLGFLSPSPRRSPPVWCRQHCIKLEYQA